jgi:hypothetical protein
MGDMGTVLLVFFDFSNDHKNRPHGHVLSTNSSINLIRKGYY